MRYVIAYDISDDRRRDRMSKALLDFGRRVQDSVFLADLDEELYRKMLDRVGKQVEELEGDKVHVFGLCGGCEKRVVTMGAGEAGREPDVVVI